MTITARAGAMGIAMMALAACSALIEVEAPEVIQPKDYETAEGVAKLTEGAYTEFAKSFGNGGGMAASSGYMSDELSFATNLAATLDGAIWDSRTLQEPAPQMGAPFFHQVQKTRQQLLTTIGALQKTSPDSTARIGHMFALLGFTEVFIAEAFCAGVPLSHRDALLQPVYGSPLTTAQLLDSAIAAFDSALVYGVDSIRITNAARVGKGRALVNVGRFAEAATVVGSVSTAYAFTVALTTSTSTVAGPGANLHFNTTASTVPDREGTNGLNWRSANDPRVPLTRRAPTSTTPELYHYTPYTVATAPLRVAGGIEARLIEAEAALQTGDVATWLARHNALRATVAGLAPLTDPGTAAARVDLHFRERGFWLFLTGHRLGDLRRLIRQYGRGAETVYPTGDWRPGQPYGAAKAMTLPLEEYINPKVTGCINTDA